MTETSIKAPRIAVLGTEGQIEQISQIQGNLWTPAPTKAPLTIEQEICLPFSKEERRVINMINTISSALSAFVNGLTIDSVQYGHLFNNAQNEEWKYFPMDHAGELYVLIKRLGIHEMTDLGCGMALWAAAISVYERMKTGERYIPLRYKQEEVAPALRVHGIENEDELISLIPHSYLLEKYINVVKGDLLELKPEDIKGQAAYTWDPIKGGPKLKQYMEKLFECIGNKYLIVYSGNMSSQLTSELQFQPLGRAGGGGGPLHVFKRPDAMLDEVQELVVPSL